ncbi:protease inhibitor I9 family protein [Pseudoalteromonas ostreae]|uniref:protease inhibitor I9 family protein n=1 Tax=Pseudoalteromonas ostreae TaxID=2774154 RepID=UPI001B38C749|nr:protease inhibitor I9 family protein [Pseudoalteromonas ostreae]
MRKLSTLSLAVLVSLAAVQTHAAELMSVDTSRAIEGKYIVVFKTPSVLNVQSSDVIADFASSQSASLSNLYNIDVAQEFGGILNGVVVNASDKTIQQMLSNPNFDYIEQDLPLNSNYYYDFDGSGVTAYVIDTAARISHNEFDTSCCST